VQLNLDSKAANGRKKIGGGGGSRGPGTGGSYGGSGGASGSDYRRQKATGHGFSADNPYGKRDAGDNRQFIRG
jgi:ATP-dependent RNA helicase DDX18/HAS1